MYESSTIHYVMSMSVTIVYAYNVPPDLMTFSGERLTDDTVLIDYLDKHITQIMINPKYTREKEKLQDFINLYNEVMDTAIVNHYKNYTNATDVVRYVQHIPIPSFLHLSLIHI